MYRLTTLGSVHLLDPQGRPVELLLAQPKRIAFLVFLAVRSPGRPDTRDALAALFWPDRSHDRARAGLRTMLWVLRNELGRDIVRTVGTSLELDPTGLWVDARALRQAVSEGEHDRAIDLYRGEFLAGYHARIGPEFEAWVVAEGARLRDLAVSAAWRAAEWEARRGNAISAATMSRRALELSRDDESAARRHFEMLRRLGDRPAALRDFDAYRRRLKATYGSRPSEATVRIVDDLRTRSARRSPLLALLPIVCVDEEGTDLVGCVREELIDRLSRVAGLRVIARSSVDACVQTSDTPPPDAVRVRIGATHFVEGRVSRTREALRFAVRIGDTASHEIVWAASYDVPQTDLGETVTRMATLVAEALPSAFGAPDLAGMESGGPSDPRALEFYWRARFAWNRRSEASLRSALSLLHEALERDPTFARAHAAEADVFIAFSIASGLGFSICFERARAAALQALRLHPNLGEARAALGTTLGVHDWRWDLAIQELERAVRLNPGYGTARQWYAVCLADLGRLDEAVVELETALELDPLSLVHQNELAWTYTRLGEFREARRRFDAVLQLEPAFWRSSFERGLLGVLEGHPEGGTGDLVEAWRAGGWGAPWEEGERVSIAFRDAGWKAALAERLLSLSERWESTPTAAVEGAIVAALLDDPLELERWLERSRADRSLGLIARFRPVFEYRGLPPVLRPLLPG